MTSHNVACIICQALGRGVTRSKRLAMQCFRKAAENGNIQACFLIAKGMYGDEPYAREVGHVEQAAGVAMSAGVIALEEGHDDVSLEVITDVMHWLIKGELNPIDRSLDIFRRKALEGGKYCRNDACEVVGHLKSFRVCPQCKNARYCGDACQKKDWTAGGHKETCGTFASCCQVFSQPTRANVV